MSGCADELSNATAQRLLESHPDRRFEVTCSESPEADDPSHYKCAVTILDAEGGPRPLEAIFVVDESGVGEPLDPGAFAEQLGPDAD